MKRTQTWLTILSGFIAGLLGAYMMLVCFFHPVNVRTVDVSALIFEFVTLQARENKSSDELKSLSLKFSGALEEQLNVLAKTEHIMIMPKEAVLSGNQDMTPMVRQALKPFLTPKRETYE